MKFSCLHLPKPLRGAHVLRCWYRVRWLWLLAAVAVLAGTASALFLWALEQASDWHAQHPASVWALPLIGGTVAWVYQRWGGRSDGGHHLLIEEIHRPKQRLPLRMAPLILLATVCSHAGGASVGREGTAVQMGGALADQCGRWAALQPPQRALLLLGGIAAGFGSVFGTPLAGAVFALEVLAVGRLHHHALLPCLLTAWAADQVARAWGVEHAHHALAVAPTWSLGACLALLVAGMAFGGMARAFVWGQQKYALCLQAWVPSVFWRPVLGGCLIAALSWWVVGPRYLGLGLPLLEQAFGPTALPLGDALGKWSFTVLSLGAGFKGGEVTPLFVMGASLGSALSAWLPLPGELLAGLGLVAVFAGASNTPLACTLLAVELFGGGMALPAAWVCTVSYLCSGPHGIYRSQERPGPKWPYWHSF